MHDPSHTALMRIVHFDAVLDDDLRRPLAMTSKVEQWLGSFAKMNEIQPSGPEAVQVHTSIHPSISTDIRWAQRRTS